MGFPCETFSRIRWGMRFAAAIAAVCALFAPPAAEPSFARASATRAELIVQLQPGANAGELRRTVRRAGGRVTRDLRLINGLGVRLDAGAARRLARHPGVLSVSPNTAVAPTATDASRLTTAYNQSIRSSAVWNAGGAKSSVGAGVGIAVIDTGIQGDLPDFRTSRTDPRSRVIASAVVNPHARTAADRYGHGTHVAGIIAGNGAARPPSDPLYGRYIGVAPGANLISVKASDDEGNATTLDVIEGLQFAVDHREDLNIRVANLSLSEDKPQPYRTNPLNAAVEQAWNAGIVVVAAAGNRGNAADAVHYAPGNDPFVITVGGADDGGTAGHKDDLAAGWSSAGVTQDGHAKPDFLAPGAHITSTLSPGSAITSLCSTCAVSGQYFRMGGTSMAAGVASGAVALMLENDPALTPNEVKSAINRNLRTVPGVGSVLDALAAARARPRERNGSNSHEPNQLLDPATGLVDYTRSSWSRSSWSAASGGLRAGWARSSWSCATCLPQGRRVSPLRSSWSRSSWSRSSWSASFSK